MQIRMQVRGLEAARRLVKQATDIATDNGPLSFAALNGAAELFEKNFDTEGGSVGGWADLADRTIAERESKGFGGAHPILVRYGDLREVTATSLRALQHSGTVQRADSDGKTIGVTVTGKRGVLNVTAFGDKAVNQEPGDDRPARPYWWVDSHVENAARKAVVEHIEKKLRRL